MFYKFHTLSSIQQWLHPSHIQPASFLYGSMYSFVLKGGVYTPNNGCPPRDNSLILNRKFTLFILEKAPA